MPEVCDGVVSLSEEDHDTNALAVVAVQPGEKIKVAQEFHVPTPMGWQNVVRTMTEWGPLNTTPNEMGQELHRVVTGHAETTPYTEINPLRPLDGGSAVTLGTIMDIRSAGFANFYDDTGQQSPSVLQPMNLSGRSILLMRYDALQVSSLVHELEHVWQHIDSPFRFALPQDEGAAKKVNTEYVLRAEMPAYYYGASAARALARLGHELTDGDQTSLRYDDTRMAYANSPTDFTPRNLAIRAEYILGGYI